jgi:hypothetical protein
MLTFAFKVKQNNIIMDREVDKVEKYIKLMCKKFGGEFVEARLSSYYNVNGRILRVSDHIGANSSGNMSIIIPSYRTEKELYMVHAHATGALSIVSYEELKNIIHSFFYMSSIFNTVNQPNFQLELEKKDKFEASDKYNVMTQELKRLKEIEKKYTRLKEKVKTQNEASTALAAATEQPQPQPIIVEGADCILGVPRNYFEKGQLKVIAATAAKVATKFGFDSKEIERLKKA